MQRHIITGGTTVTTPSTTVATARPRPVIARARAYARLGKFQVYQMVLPCLVAFAGVPHWTPRGVVVALLLTAAGWMMVGVSLGLDDIVGYEEDLDERTFTHDRVHRPLSMKPLVTGDLQLHEAKRFVVLLCGAVAVCGVAALLLAPYGSLRGKVLLSLATLLTSQYSAGLKLSYRFGTEIMILGSMSLMAIGPFYLLAGELPGWLLTEAALLGAWLLQVSWFSYAIDADEDRSVGRLSLASVLGWRWLRWFITALFATTWTVIALFAASGGLPLWGVALLSPALLLQARQLWIGVRHARLVEARALGFHAYTAGAVALIIVNLIAH